MRWKPVIQATATSRLGNPLKAMTNRTGKREREARNRHKRCRVTLLIGGVPRTLKLGRKKEHALSMASLGAGEIRVHDYLPPRHNDVNAAVPVALMSKASQNSQGEADA